jgi:urate oxidase
MTTVTVEGEQAWVVSGLRDLVVLNSAGSEFWGFAKDRYTTLAETTDRILATAVDARWRHAEVLTGDAWLSSYQAARDLLLTAFAETHSYSLQQTLYAMGKAVLEGLPSIAEIRLSLPNKHHFEVDMSPFGRENKGEVFYASDRPYGLIEGTVLRDDGAPCAGPPSDPASSSWAW